MKITFVETEIRQAIIDYVEKQGFCLTGKDVEISLGGGRGPAGYTAEAEISQAANVPVQPPKLVTSEPKAKVEIEAEDTPEPAEEAEDFTKNDAEPEEEETSEPAETKSLFR